MLLAAVWVWCLLALLVGQLAACGLVLQLWWVGAALVGWQHLLVAASRPQPFAVWVACPLQCWLVGVVVFWVGVGA